MPIQITENEKQTLRRLATEVRQRAKQPQQKNKRTAARAINDLSSEKPVVYCLAEGAWLECIPPESLVCKDDVLRGWEMRLRMMLMSNDLFQDDQPVDLDFNISYDVHFENLGLDLHFEGEETDKRHPYFLQANCPITLRSHSELTAFHIEPAIKEYSDIEKIKMPNMVHNSDNSADWLNTAQEIFGDLLNVRRRAYYWELLTGYPASLPVFRGMEHLWIDMVDEPEWVHDFSARLAAVQHHQLNELEKANLLTLNNENEWVGTGGLGATSCLPTADFDPAYVKLKDVWGGLQAQDLVGISPTMFEEFFMPHIKPVMERFGLSHFGCCEPIHHWLPMLKEIRGLRRVSVSPWGDVQKCAEMLGPDYVFCWKPNPADVCTDKFNDEYILNKARNTLRITKEHGCHVEIIMKDLHTILHEPQRLTRWVALMHQAIDEVY